MRFFLDNCLSPKFARALDALEGGEGHRVHHLVDKFPDRRDIPDREWIRALAEERDWVIVSGDPRITRNAAEREAWLESGLTAFFLGKGWMTVRLWDQAWKLVQWWPRITDQAAKVQPPAGFVIPVRGSKFEVVSRAR